MRSLVCLIVSAGFSLSCLGQTTPLSFLDQLKAQSVRDSALRTSITWTGSADWIAGSTHESGPAKLVARTNGSYEVLLALDSATRADSFGPFTSRTCQWIDKNGSSHLISGISCSVPLPWFSPALLPLLLGAPGIVVTDEGEVTEGGQLQHTLTLSAGTTDSDSANKFLVDTTRVAIQYNATTLLPTSLEYNLYADAGNGQPIPVKVTFSDYRTVSGVSVPFHIERSINRTLQLTVVVDSVLIN